MPLSLPLSRHLHKSCQDALSLHSGFSSERKNGLRSSVSCCFRRSSGGISLYDIDLTVCRILVRTVGKFSRKRHSFQSGFSPCQIPGLPCRFPGSLCHHRFFNGDLGHIRILFQEDLQLSADNIIDRSPGLTVSKLLLRLSFKLGILDLYADDRSKSFSDILPRKDSVHCPLAVYSFLHNR